MSPTHEQFVFGPGSADSGDGRTAPRTPRSRTQPTIAELPPEDELSVLCGRVAEAMPPRSRTALVLVAVPRPPGPPGTPVAAAVATSSPPITAVVRIEWLLQEGPVRASLESGETTVSERLGADRRWPRFARAVPAHEAVSAAAVPVPLGRAGGSGVLAAYSADAGAFDPRDLRTLAAFAGIVGDVVGRTGPGAQAAEPGDPVTDRLVNQAVGVLITRHCDEEQARRRLGRISGSTGRPLVEAARMIVDEAKVEAHLRFVVRSAHRQSSPTSG